MKTVRAEPLGDFHIEQAAEAVLIALMLLRDKRGLMIALSNDQQREALTMALEVVSDRSKIGASYG